MVLGVKISDCLWYGSSSVKYLRPLKNSFISHFSFSNYLNVVYKIAEISVLRCSAFFMVQLSHPYMTTGKTIALTRWTFVGKIMSLLFNMLTRFVIAFLPRSKCLFISWLQLPSTVILEPNKIKYVIVSIFPPIYLLWSDGTRCHDLSFLNVEF